MRSGAGGLPSGPPGSSGRDDDVDDDEESDQPDTESWFAGGERRLVRLTHAVPLLTYLAQRTVYPESRPSKQSSRRRYSSGFIKTCRRSRSPPSCRQQVFWRLFWKWSYIGKR